MRELLVAVFLLVPAGLLVWMLLWTRFRTRFVVDHRQRVRQAIRCKITGRIQILGPGVHYRWPWWVADELVDLNREPRETTDDNPILALDSDGVELRLGARWDEITGRRFNPHSGQLPPEDNDEIWETGVLWAITRTDFSNREMYVRGIVKKVLEDVIGAFTADQLLDPNYYAEIGKAVKVPKKTLRESRDPANPTRTIGYALRSVKVTDRQELLNALSHYVEREVNFRLRHVGYNIRNFYISDLRAESAAVQAAQDRRQELVALVRANKALDGLDLSDTEKVALTSGNFGDAAKAAAWKSVAEALREATPQIAEAISKIGK